MVAAINSRADLEAIKGTPDYERFLDFLAGTVYRYEWDGGDWALTEDTSVLGRFGVSKEMLANIPVPDKPAFNPDEQALAQQAREVRAERNRLLRDTDWTVLPDAPVSDAQAWQGYRQSLRDVPQQDGFPTEVVWPVAP
jgi:hypothetical protein